MTRHTVPELVQNNQHEVGMRFRPHSAAYNDPYANFESIRSQELKRKHEQRVAKQQVNVTLKTT